jgi:hypothetical protein
MLHRKDLKNKLKVADAQNRQANKKPPQDKLMAVFKIVCTIKICCSTHRATCFSMWANHDECLHPKHPNHR